MEGREVVTEGRRVRVGEGLSERGRAGGSGS